MKYSHIFFDWHGVLSHTGYWSHIPEYPLIKSELFASHHPLLREWALGKRKVSDFIEEMAKSTGLSASYLMETLKESCESLEFASDKIPDFITGLKAKGIVCVISTDNFDVFDNWTVPILNLDSLFDDILNSFDLKHVKVELVNDNYSPFFSPYLKAHKVRKALWLDDNDYSLQAKSLGMDFKLVKLDDDLIDLVDSALS